MENTTKISINRCEDYDRECVSSAVDQTFEYFGGLGNIIKKGDSVLLKPNFIKESSPEESAITHPVVIEVIAEKVMEFGAVPIIGDSPAFGALSKIAGRVNLDKFAKRHNIKIVELDRPQKVNSVCGAKPFPLTVSKKALEVDAIINIPKLKAHVQLLFTAAVKNMYGCVCGKRKVWRHFRANNDLRWYTEMLLANYQAVKPAFTVVDAVMAMEERGPTGGVPRRLSLIIAGTDCIAIDRIIAEILGVQPLEVPVLQTAKIHNIGEQDLNRIEILGEKLSSAKAQNFALPELSPIGFNLFRVIKSLFKHLWLKSFCKAAMFLLVFYLLIPFCTAFAEEAESSRLKHFPQSVEVDDIVHVSTGVKIEYSDLYNFFDSSRIIYVGEIHAFMPSHEAQLKVLKACYDRYGDGLAIGMEMFTRPFQPFLDQFIAGEIDEERFLKDTQWDTQWGFDYNLYKDILDFAREKKISVVALNAPKDMVGMVSEKGLEALNQEEESELPKIDTSDYFHQVYLQEVIGGHMKRGKAIERYNEVQCLWEEHMAQSITNYLSSWEGKGKKLLVFVGNGHIIYDFGIPKRVFRRSPLPYCTVYPAVFDGNTPTSEHHLFMPEIPLEPADFVWVISTESLQKKRVLLGVRIKSYDDNRLIIQKVSEGGPAERAGFMEGDEILSIDGRKMEKVMELVHYLQTKEFGDTCAVTINRDGTRITYAVELFEMQ